MISKENKMKKIFIAIVMLGIVFQNSVSQAQSCQTPSCSNSVWPPQSPTPVDPVKVFDRNICQGSPFTLHDAIRYMAPSASSAKVADLKPYFRIRNCNQFTGCSSWKLATYEATRNHPQFDFDEIFKVNNIELVVNTTSASPNFNFTSIFSLQKLGQYDYAVPPKPSYYITKPSPHDLIDISSRPTILSDSFYLIFIPNFRSHFYHVTSEHKGFVFNNCAWFSQEARSSIDSSASWKEVQSVFYGALLK
jgi:hypothetical protein